MRIESSGLTDVGQLREHNEDSYEILDEYDLFIVADGMGGHNAGDVASQMATETMCQFFVATQNEDATWPFHFDPSLTIEENRLVTSIKLANRKIFEASSRNREMRGMGTTVVSLVTSKKSGRIYVAHVGDSRCYRIRDGEITLLTRDHSLLNDYLLVMPDMPQEQQDELPKNVITRALGMQDSVVVDLLPDRPMEGDIYVLCSDGLSGMIDDDGICELVVSANNDCEKAAKALVDKANENGGEDNVTAVVIRVTDVPEWNPEDEETADVDNARLAVSTTLEPGKASTVETRDDLASAKTLEMDSDAMPTRAEYEAARQRIAEIDDED